jgi:protein-tyrosine phosphatase
MKLYPVPAAAAGRISLCTRPDPDDLEGEARTLADHGVTRVVSLLPVEEERSSHLEGEAAALQLHGITFERMPAPDFGVPDGRQDVAARLRALAGTVSEPSTHIVVHCAAGLGRSPTVAAALLVLLGEAPDEAWDVVTAARGATVPETDEQRRWPRRFTAG